MIDVTLRDDCCQFSKQVGVKYLVKVIKLEVILIKENHIFDSWEIIYFRLLVSKKGSQFLVEHSWI